MPQLSWGQYKVAVPDFSDVGKDLDDMAMRMHQYREQKKMAERKRKDMMWKQFLANTNVTPASLVNENLQKHQSAILEATRQNLVGIVKEKEGDLDWKDIQKGRNVKNQAQKTIGLLEKFEEARTEDLAMIREDLDKFTDEFINYVTKWDGKTAYSPPKKQLRPKNPNELVAEMDFDSMEAVNDKLYNMEGELIRSGSEYVDKFYDFKGGRPVHNEQEQFKALRPEILDQRYYWAENFSKLSKEEKEMYQARAEGKDRTAIEQYAFETAQPQKFKVRKSVDYSSDRERRTSPGGGPDVQSFDYKKAQKYTDIPKEFGKEAKLIQVADENIDFDRNVLRNAIVKKKGKWKKMKGDEYFDDAKFKGVVVKEKDGGKELYARVGIRLPKEYKKTEDGKQIWATVDPETGEEMEGTLEQLSEKTGQTKSTLQNMAFKAKTDSKVSDALVPVDDNEFIKGFYEIKNLPDVSGGTQSEGEKDDKILPGW
jgi:hypothetical protein